MVAGGASPTSDPIAIVGIGCRLPGGADSPEALWSRMGERFEAVGRIPPSRFDADEIFDERPATRGRIMSPYGGYLDGIEDLDAEFFELAPREAERLDPQQRLLLETAWEALEDAGIAASDLAGGSTGVFTGLWLNDLEARYFADKDDIDFYMTTGTGRYAASGRISFFFDFVGPSITVDTACSSSLVAVHLACQSIRSGECEVALAGGANVILQPDITIAYSQSRMMTPDGRCKFGDASASGYVRSEGAGMVALKRLSAAQRDGDRIRAVIRGSSVSNDGRSSGFLATPGQEGQEEMLRRAYANADVDPSTIQYVEAHGTGTAAGDPVEIGALGAVLGSAPRRREPLLVGSLKTNVGHTEGAAGVAGLIKLSLALEEGVIPPSLHMAVPNPAIPWDELNIRVNTENTPWPHSDSPRRGGVSAFGIAGTNAHVVVEAPPAPTEPSAADVPDHRTEATSGPYVLPLSAGNAHALQELAARYRAVLSEAVADDRPALLHDLTASAALRRTHLGHRLGAVADDPNLMLDVLERAQDGEVHPGLVTGRTPEQRPRVVFVFPGQGSQWPSMARELLATAPAFRDSMEAVNAAIRAEAGWSPIDVINAEPDDPRLEQIDVIQPLLCAVQIALAAQWRAWGVEPSAVVGHSMGEVAAAHVSGSLSLEDAVAVICGRSLLLRRVRGQGSMAVVDLSVDEAAAAIVGLEDKLDIAVSNSQRSTVLSGDPAAIDTVMAQLRERDVFCRPVKVDVASHSPQMEPLLDELRDVLGGLSPTDGSVPFHSTVEAAELPGTALTPDYWTRNLRQPVRFGETTDQLCADGKTLFVEISPHPILLPAIEQVVADGQRDAAVVASMRRDEPERHLLLTGLATLYAHGVNPDWRALSGTPAGHVQLPTYPWQRERHWYEPETGQDRDVGGHPLLGSVIRSSIEPGTTYWQTRLNGPGLELLNDHLVRGDAILPATGFVELALRAGEETFGEGSHELVELSLKETLPIGGDEDRLVQVTLESIGGDEITIGIHSRSAQSAPGDDWTTHGTGALRRLAGGNPATDHPGHLPPAEIRNRLVEHGDDHHYEARHHDGADHYAQMATSGLDFGPAFRTVSELWIGEQDALARVELEAIGPNTPNSASLDRIRLLDGCLQLGVAALSDPSSESSFLPVGIDRLRSASGPGMWSPPSGEPGLWSPPSGEPGLWSPPSGGPGMWSPPSEAWAHARFEGPRSGDVDSDVLRCDISLVDADGVVVVVAEGVEYRRFGGRRGATDLLHHVVWKDAERDGTDNLTNDLTDELAVDLPSTWVVYAGSPLGDEVAASLDTTGHCIRIVAGSEAAARGESTLVVRPDHADDHRWALAQARDRADGSLGVVYTWSGDPAGVVDGEQVAESVDGPAGAIIAALQGLLAVAEQHESDVGRFWLVTNGAQRTGRGAAERTDPDQALLWGIGRTAANELPSMRCTLIDIDIGDGVATADLVAELTSGSEDRQVAFRSGVRLVPRVTAHPSPGPDGPEPGHVRTDSYRLMAASPGSIDGLRLQLAERTEPGPGQLEIAISAAGLNFLDVLKTMGICPGFEPSPDIALGGECAGTVTAVGAGVTEFAVGDEVMAITSSYADTSLLASFVTLPTGFVAHRPSAIDGATAAGLPVAYLTAYYSLVELGRVSAGDRVLIQAATGGVGLAAIEICRAVGAEVFATAGTPEKREHLRSLGVQHIFDSRTLAFAAGVREATDGAGVDIVLNSLVGDAIPAGLSTLGPRGRFIEIGKRDVFDNRRLGLETLKNNLSFLFVDLAELTEQEPDYVAGIFAAVVQRIADGDFGPLPTTSSPITTAADVFRRMAQAEHIGKLVLTVSADSEDAHAGVVRPDSTYLITGGLGALGLAVAERFAALGARHLALMGRSGPSADARRVIDRLTEAGVSVSVVNGDVAKRADVDRVLESVRRSMPPLRGVVHSAGVLADATIARMDDERLRAALAPKVSGAGNLHAATLGDDLELFVLFSSVATLLGVGGQSNYAAANAYMDGLAQRRVAEGRPALSVQWGPWVDIGLAAAEDGRGNRLADRGLGGLESADALDALEDLLTLTNRRPASGGDGGGVDPVFSVMSIDSDRWIAAQPEAAELLSALTDLDTDAEPAVSVDALIDQLLALPPGGPRRVALQDVVAGHLGTVLRISADRIDRTRPLKAMGLDSLMALELRNKLEAEANLKLSATAVFNFPTVVDLADHLADRMALAVDIDAESSDQADGTVDEISPAPGTEPPTDLADADDEELAALLADELATIDVLLDADGGGT